MQPREIDLQVALALGLNVQCGERVFMGVLWGEGNELFVRNEDGAARDIPNYSTDLTAAFEVGEALWPDGWGVQKVSELIDGADWVTHWEAGPMHSHWTDEMGIEVKEIDPLAEANTPAMAICLAALKSKGVEVGG